MKLNGITGYYCILSLLHLNQIVAEITISSEVEAGGRTKGEGSSIAHQEAMKTIKEPLAIVTVDESSCRSLVTTVDSRTDTSEYVEAFDKCLEWSVDNGNHQLFGILLQEIPENSTYTSESAGNMFDALKGKIVQNQELFKVAFLAAVHLNHERSFIALLENIGKHDNSQDLIECAILKAGLEERDKIIASIKEYKDLIDHCGYMLSQAVVSNSLENIKALENFKLGEKARGEAICYAVHQKNQAIFDELVKKDIPYEYRKSALANSVTNNQKGMFDVLIQGAIDQHCIETCLKLAIKTKQTKKEEEEKQDEMFATLLTKGIQQAFRMEALNLAAEHNRALMFTQLLHHGPMTEEDIIEVSLPVVKLNRQNIVNTLVHNGISDEYVDVLLKLAREHNNGPMIEVLMHQGTLKSRFYPLDYAIEFGNEEIFDFMLTRELSEECVNDCLASAALYGKKNMLEELLTKKHDQITQEGLGRALISAIRINRPEIVKYLLEKKIELTQLKKALEIASIYERPQIIKLLKWPIRLAEFKKLFKAE